MPKSLKDTIREEFKKKLKQPKFIKLIDESDLIERILINSIESLGPDEDWKKHKGPENDDKLARVNANKLINNINSQLLNEN